MRLWFKTNFWKTLKELLPVGLGQAFAALGGLVGVRLLTQVMTPETYGELALALTFTTLVQQLIMGPLSGAFARFFPVAQEQKQVSLYLSVMKTLLSKALVLITVIFLVLLGGLLILTKTVWSPLMFFAYLFTIISMSNIVIDNLQNAARHRLVVAWHQGASQWLRFLLAAAIILWLGQPLSFYAMVGYFISALIIILSQWFFFRKNFLRIYQNIKESPFSKIEKKKWEQQILKFTYPFSTWGGFGWLQSSSDRWALSFFQPVAAVGHYTALYQLGYLPISLLTGIFVQFLTPILFKKAGDGSEQNRLAQTNRLTNSLFALALVLAGLVFGLVWFNHELIFRYLVAAEYRSYSYLLPYMALTGGLFAAGQICAITPLNNNQPRKLVLPKIVTSLIGLSLNYLGAFHYGVAGVVYAEVVYAIIYCLWLYFLFSHQSFVRFFRKIKQGASHA